jgi:hypothetical protein
MSLDEETPSNKADAKRTVGTGAPTKSMRPVYLFMRTGTLARTLTPTSSAKRGSVGLGRGRGGRAAHVGGGPAAAA